MMGAFVTSFGSWLHGYIVGHPNTAAVWIGLGLGCLVSLPALLVEIRKAGHPDQKRNSSNDSQHRLPANSGDPQPHGILGDFVDVTIEDAQYGDAPYYKPALKGVLRALSDKRSLRPDGAISVGVNTQLLIGESEYLPGVYKHLKMTFSAKLHESKALTIRPGDRLHVSEIPQASPKADIISPVTDAVVVQTRGVFMSLSFASKHALKILYTQPGLTFSDITGRLEQMGFADPGKALGALRSTHLAAFLMGSNAGVLPSNNPAIAAEVERLLKAV